MKVNKELIDKLSELAKLEFDESAKEQIITDLDRIIQFVEKLQEVDTSNTEPLIYVNEDVNVLREDKVNHDISKEEALKNAPEADSDYFKMPKVLKKSNE